MTTNGREMRQGRW